MRRPYAAFGVELFSLRQWLRCVLVKRAHRWTPWFTATSKMHFRYCRSCFRVQERPMYPPSHYPPDDDAYAY